VKRGGAVPDLADLTGTSGRNVPGVPGCGEHVLTTEEDTPEGIIGPAYLVVERRHAGAGCRRQPRGRIGGAAVGSKKLDTLRVVRERVNPTVAIIVKIGVKAPDVDSRSV